MWGDTFHHYWSTLTGAAFYLYAQCVGDNTYKRRAENIVRNNLCLFFEDGKASCAYIYPNRVNGSEAAYKYTIEGSPDGKSYKMLVDGRTNWQVGFLILNVEDPTAYRYLRLRIYGVVNVHKGNSAMWALVYYLLVNKDIY